MCIRDRACVVEEHHDQAGIVWPAAIAPYQVHLVVLGRKAPAAVEAAEQLYRDLWTAGIEVLMDDRDESPGVKFNDADLIGLPLRITVGDRGLKAGGVELKLRRGGEARLAPLADIVSAVRAELATDS